VTGISLRNLDAPDAEHWHGLTATIRRLPLTQSWAYAEAMASARGWLPDYYQLQDANGQGLGGCVIQRRHLGFRQAIRIERGPFFYTSPDADTQKAALEQLHTITKPGWLDQRRFYPALTDTPENVARVREAGFRAIDPGYHTIWLDLTVPLPKRRRQLRQNWRYALNKAEQSAIEIVVESNTEHLNWLIAHHVNNMRRRRYVGPSAALLMKIGELTAPRDEYRLIRGMYLGKPIAGGLFIRHGRSATYLVGWSGKLGRKYNAQNAILWQALATLADDGCRDLDLGGLNPERAAGVTYFKRGLLTTGDEEHIAVATCR